jgi:prepilin peptidase CpaA
VIAGAAAVGGVATSVAFAVAVADAAVSDLRTFRIPDRDSLLLAAAFAVSAGVSGMAGQAVLLHLAAGLVVFVAGAVLFGFGIWGGGDAKLLAAVALWTGFAGLAGVLLVMAVAGGVLALSALALRRLPIAKPDWAKVWRQRVVDGGHVPYGVAIAVAALGWWWSALRPI